MILETIRACAEWLAHPTTGVAAQLAALPLDGGDERPTVPVAVADETRVGWVARRERPQEDRQVVVTVTQDTPITMAGESVATYRPASVSLAVQVWSPLVQSEAAITALHYTARAVQRSLRGWLAGDAAGEAARTRGGVYVQAAEEWSVTPVESSEVDALSVVSIVVPLTVRDQQP